MLNLHFSPRDAPSLVFLPSTGTCSLNQSYGYAFGVQAPVEGKNPARSSHHVVRNAG